MSIASVLHRGAEDRADRSETVSVRAAAILVASILFAAGLLGACGGNDATRRGERRDTTCDGKVDGTTNLTVWFHVAGGTDVERGVVRRQVEAFNASHPSIHATLITLPQGDYNDYVRSAAASGNLPDVLDFDGPNLYNYAWSGRLKPIDSCLTGAMRADLLPSLLKQGTYARRTWGVGTFDSGLGLYVRRSVLERAGIRIPRTPAEAWTIDEFDDALRRLRAAGYRRPLDLKLSYLTQPVSEWSLYGFAPAIWSAGGDLIDRRDYRTVEGVLNGPGAVKAMGTLQRWVAEGYVDPDRDGKAFEKGRTPISWVGHWMYEPYRRASGGDMAIVPLPNFGRGTATGMGSWQWGITANAADGDAAWQFLSFLLKPDEVLRMTRTNGSIPGTRTALRRSPEFADGGPEHLYLQQLESGVARPRPQTPAYPAITAAFRRATTAILLRGARVKPALDAAAKRVDRDLAQHKYYRSTEP
jgi:multiple sugar transport system substrate-binding protein